MTAAILDAKVRPTQPRPYAGFGQMVRFMARRDRVRASIWIAGIVGLVVASAVSTLALYNTPAELQQYADLVTSDSALKAIAGPGYGLNMVTKGAVVMNEVEMYSFIAIALMCVFLMVRHTRAEEESDRAELVRAASVGRLAILAAAAFWVTAVNAVVAVGLFAGLAVLGLAVQGAAAYAVAGFALGMVFVGITAVTAQVASSARSARSTAGGVLGVAFLLRAVGDLGTTGVSWASPLGWALNIRAFANERWWVLALMLPAAAALISAGAVLSARRDLGAGILPQRPGPAEAHRYLASPFALAARLQRPSLIGWTVGIAAMGFFFGIVADQADAILENQAVADMLMQAGAGSPVDSFLATMVLMIGLIVSGFTVSSVLRMRAEETAGHFEPVLATPTSRRDWLLGSVVVTVAGSVVLMLVAGLGLGVGYAIQIRDVGQIPRVVGAALNLVPALLVIAALPVALTGLRLKWAPLAWIGVTLSATVGLLAQTLRLPQWFQNLSPFEHPAALPAASFAYLPTVLLLVVSAGLLGLGIAGLQRRDIG